MEIELPEVIRDFLHSLPDDRLMRVRNAHSWRTNHTAADENNARCLLGHVEGDDEVNFFDLGVGWAFDDLFGQGGCADALDVSDTPEVAAIRQLAASILEQRRPA